MSQNTGLCPLCGGEKAAGATTFAVDLGFGVVVVRRVPAHVCALCGEAWLDDSVAEKLEAMVDDARQAQAVVEVTDWANVS